MSCQENPSVSMHKHKMRDLCHGTCKGDVRKGRSLYSLPHLLYATMVILYARDLHAGVQPSVALPQLSTQKTRKDLMEKKLLDALNTDDVHRTFKSRPSFV